MEKKRKKLLFIGLSLFASFILWTVLILFIDVQKIGPNESSVGFATLNEYIHNITGTNMILYTITDWLGLVPIAIAFSFAIFGLVQWIKRKKILKVDQSILTLGVFYIFVMIVYILFEIVVINYRPILINGYLEASYPSSTTMLVMCVMPSTMIQLHQRIKDKKFKNILMIVIIIFTFFMIIGRIISGVHWITDIIGATLFSAAIVLIYYSINKIL